MAVIGANAIRADSVRHGPFHVVMVRTNAVRRGDYASLVTWTNPTAVPMKELDAAHQKKIFQTNPSVNAKTIPIVTRILSAVSIDVSRFKGHSRLNVGRTYHYAIYVMLRILAISFENKYFSKVHSNQSRVFRLD